MTNPKVLPCDIEAERYVLGSCLNSIDAVNYACAELSIEEFVSPENRDLFEKIKHLYSCDSPVTLDTLCHVLNKSSMQKTVTYLVNLSIETGTGVDYSHYAKILKNKSSLRKVIYAAQAAIDEAVKQEADPDKITADMQNKILASQGLGERPPTHYNHKLEDFHQGLDFYEAYMHKLNCKLQGISPYQGVASNYPQLDHALGQFQPGALYYIGARTSMGKTTLMCNLVRQMMHSYSIGIFSLEQPAFRLVEKIACMDAHLKHTDYEDATLSLEKQERLKEAIRSSRTVKIIIEDPSSISITKLAARAKRMRNSGIQILFVDYLTRIKHDGQHSNKHLMVDEVSKGLQNLAKEINVPIVCFAQLNRHSTTKERPTLTDFRESGSIEEDADGCLFIHRPSYYDKTQKPGLTEIIIAKNRLRGILKTIDFSCNYQESEVYHEIQPLEEAIRDAEKKVQEKQMQEFESYFQEFSHCDTK